MDIDVKNLHPLEVKLLRHVGMGEDITVDRLVAELGYLTGQCNQAFSWLGAKGFLTEHSRTAHTFYEMTEQGQEQRLH